jgi:hypothetical protein
MNLICQYAGGLFGGLYNTAAPTGTNPNDFAIIVPLVLDSLVLCFGVGEILVDRLHARELRRVT